MDEAGIMVAWQMNRGAEATVFAVVDHYAIRIVGDVDEWPTNGNVVVGPEPSPEEAQTKVLRATKNREREGWTLHIAPRTMSAAKVIHELGSDLSDPLRRAIAVRKGISQCLNAGQSL